MMYSDIYTVDIIEALVFVRRKQASPTIMNLCADFLY